MSPPARKTKADSTEQFAARMARERERKNKRTAYIIAGIVVATVLTIFGVFYYQNSVAPFHKVVIRVDDVEVRMGYFLERTSLTGSDPMYMLQSLTNEIVIKLAAPQYGINVTPQDIDRELRSIAVGGSENTTISEAEFKEWYRQQLNDTGLSDAMFRELISTQLLVNRCQEYVAQQTPTVVEHVYLHIIAVKTRAEADSVKFRLNAGESFATVAREVSQDPASRENGGEVGWIPHGVIDLFDAAFSLNISEISDPLPYYPEPYSAPSAYYIFMVSEKADRQAEETYIPALQAQAFQKWLNAQTAKYTFSWYGLKNGFDDKTYAWINYQLSKM